MKYLVLLSLLISYSVFGASGDVLTITAGTSTFQTGGTAGSLTNNETRSVNFLGTSNDITGVLRVEGSLIATQATVYIGEIVGVTDASVSTAGYLGEVITSLRASGSATGLSTGTASNVVSISLTAGDWDVSGNINFIGATATASILEGGINTTSLTLPTDGTEVFSGVTALGNGTDSVTIPRKVVNVSSTTTVYLVGKTTFSVGSVSVYGSITARRVR